MENINFEEILHNVCVGNMTKYKYLTRYVVKQISRCRYKIKEEKCYVQARYNGEYLQVIISNNTSVYEFRMQLYCANDEPSVEFMISKILDDRCLLIEMLKEYQSKYYISGKKLINHTWYKMYSRIPLEDKYREQYDASWIDYEEQLNHRKIIYDEGIGGLWAMPAKLMLDCFNHICRTRYGNRVFVVKPIDDCFYFIDEKEIIGERFEVIDSMSVENADDMGKLTNYLINDERLTAQRLLDREKEKKEKIRSERDYYLESFRELYYKNQLILKSNKKGMIIGLIIGVLVGLLFNILF